MSLGKHWNRACLVLLIGMAATPGGMAHGRPQEATGAASAAETHAAKREVVRTMTCPSPLERFLPGVYYYCVGARDLAGNREARGIDMLKTAAGWGSKPAQLTLGLAYYKGDVVAANRPLGLAWLGLAAERRDPYATGIFRSAWEKASPQERQQAQALWESMLPQYGDRRAAQRAELRYRRIRKELMRRAAYNEYVCMAGLTSDTIPPPTPDGPASCPNWMPVSVAANLMDVYADNLFEGWSGHVTVGSLQQVAPPASEARK